MEPKEQLDGQIKKLQEDLKSRSQHLNDITNAIKKLRHDRKVTIGAIQEINGAIVGYSESLKLFSPEVPVLTGEVV